MTFTRRFVLGALSASLLPVPAAIAQSDPLPSWNDGAAKKSNTDFVERVTTQGNVDSVPPAGQLDKAWDESKAKGWTVVDMKQDWKKIFAFEP
jgi:hypothetical protein